MGSVSLQRPWINLAILYMSAPCRVCWAQCLCNDAIFYTGPAAEADAAPHERLEMNIDLFKQHGHSLLANRFVPRSSASAQPRMTFDCLPSSS